MPAFATAFQANAFQNNAFQIVPSGADRSDGSPRGGGRKRRRHRDADDELSESEVQFMRRKLAELKSAKTERERVEAAKSLEIALAQAAQDDDVADAISAEIQDRHPGGIPKADYGPIMRDIALLTSITNHLDRIVKQAAAEHRAREEDEDDVAILMMVL